MMRDVANAAAVQTQPAPRVGREPRIDIVTKSYAPDFESCCELHASVLRHTSPGVVHRLIVPKSDVALFGTLRSERLEISCTEEKLPAHFWSAQHVDVVFKTLAVMASPVRKMRRSAGELFVNTRRIWPPVRGWILQQIVKLAAVAESDADILITIDSDVALSGPSPPTISGETELRTSTNGAERSPTGCDGTSAGAGRRETCLVRRRRRPFQNRATSLRSWSGIHAS